jgi:hypothetical protein
MTITLGDVLRQEADAAGRPLKTLKEVEECLDACKKSKPKGTVDIKMARMMLRYGRMTAEAREYVAREYPQCTP